MVFFCFLVDALFTEKDDPFNFEQNLSKLNFVWPVLANFPSIRKFFFLMSVISPKDKKPVANLDYLSVKPPIEQA